MNSCRSFVIGSILCLCWFSGYAGQRETASYQREPIRKESFSQAKWEELRRKVKISEPKPKPPKDKKVKKDKKTNWEIDPATKLIIKWTLFVVLIGLLLFLVLYTLGINPFQRKKNGVQMALNIDSVAEHLDEADLDPFLLEAIKSGQYKLAIRLYYLQIIQRLNFAGKIRWKRHKTNKHYLNEMFRQQDYAVFKELTREYEKSWFGPDPISPQQYERVVPAFINYAKNLPAVE